MRTVFEELLKFENEDVCVNARSPFFVITSENVCQITKSHIFGYCIIEDRCYKNCDLENEELQIEKGYGSYIYLHKTETEIEVSGDENGSICIYLYKNDDYWAFSNSFWMLCDEVTKEHQITLDENYAKHYMNVQLASLSAKNTLAKEIKIVPLHSIISIKGEKLKIRKISKEIFLYAIDSEEALSIIDKWIEDWMFLMDSLVQSGYPISFDLTGGFDSRVVFALARVAGIDFDRKNVRVFSIVPTTQGQIKHNGEDYDIANKICSYYGITLNKKIEGYNSRKLTGKQSFNLAWHSRLAFHKQASFFDDYQLAPVFHVGGRFGEPIRGKIRDIDTWFTYATSPHFGAREFDIVSYKEVIDSIREGKEDRDNLLSRHITLVNFYNKTWSRTHYGLEGFQNFCINRYHISPLSDGRLLQIRPTFENNADPDLIYAIIIMRICPELLKFPFARGERFSDETLAMAEKINALKKPCLNSVSVKRGIDFSSLGDSQFKISHDNSLKSGEEILEELFRDELNKNAFISRFGIIGEKIYEKALSDYRDDSIIFPVQRIVPIVAIMRMLQYEKDSLPYNNQVVLQREQLGMLKKLMEEYPESKRLKSKCIDVFPQILKEKGIRSIGIYGAGNRGQWLCKKLALTDIMIVFAADQNPEALLPGIKMIPIYEQFPQVDAIIVTPEGHFEEIREMLLHKDRALNLIDLQDYI